MAKQRLVLITATVILMIFISGCASLGTVLPPDIEKPPIQPGVPDDSPGEPPTTPVLSNLGGRIKLAGADDVLRPITIHIGDRVVTTYDGHFTIEGLEHGKYEIAISADHYQTYEGQVTITSEPSMLEVTLQVKYAKEDLELFARLVYAEAAGEPQLGQIAVAASILNRVVSSDYPNTLREVILQTVEVGGVQYYQYSPVLDGRIWELDPESQPEAYAASLEAINCALAGQDPSEGATGFYNPSKVPPSHWVRNQTPTVRIGNHQFFL